RAPRHLPSFPTRRSSDLPRTRGRPKTKAPPRRHLTAAPGSPVPYPAVLRGSRGYRPTDKRPESQHSALSTRCWDSEQSAEIDVADRKSTRLNSSHVKISY